MSMDVAVRGYGPARSHLGSETIVLRLPEGARVLDVIGRLEELGGELATLIEHSAVAVGDEIVERSHRLRNGDEVALLPPVAGG